MRGLITFLIAMIWATGAFAADKPQYGPPSVWVKPAEIPKTLRADGSTAVEILLMDLQDHYGGGTDESYGETVIGVQTPQGLATGGNIALTWNPETETLVIHKIHIIRDGRIIDVLASGQSFTVLRRENNLELAVLDGRLTAALQPEGLRVGDMVDLAATVRRSDPVMRGMSERITGNPGGVPVRRLRIRQTWPREKPMRWRQTDDLASAKVSKGPSGTEVVIDMVDVRAPKLPKGAPARFAEVAQLEVTQFADWAEVSSLMAPLYGKAATLGPDAPLRAEAARIKAASNDPKIRAEAALRLVQDQIRYVFLGMNSGGYTPVSADATWSRRFGDCKGKTAVLLALLHELGIQAEPALISVAHGDGLDARLPLVEVFDHVLVRAVIGGKVYWLDGTRSGDRRLDRLVVPNFKWALPVRASGAALEKLVVTPPSEPLAESHIHLDASAGLKAPAPARLEMILRGDGATSVRAMLEGLSRDQAEQTIKDYWSKQYDWIKIERVSFSTDENTGDVSLSMHGAAAMAWTSDTRGALRYEADGAGLGWKADLKREPGPNRDAPFAVNHPAYDRSTETIVLPKGVSGFTVAGADLDRTVAGIRFTRKSVVENGVFRMEASSRAVAPEFPASEAEPAMAALREMRDVTVYLRAPVTYQATQQDVQALLASAPTTASEFIERGNTLINSGDYDRAIADFDQALKLEPKSALALADRGIARFWNKDLDAAAVDIEAAIKLDPREVIALHGLALIHAANGRHPQAVHVLTQVLELQPDDTFALFQRGKAWMAQSDYGKALADASEVLRLNPEHTSARFLRVQILQLQGSYDKALAEADQVVTLEPGEAVAHGIRGDLLGRLGRYGEARKAFDISIKLKPTVPGYLGRALSRPETERRQALADIELAARLDPSSPEPWKVKVKILHDGGDSAGATIALGEAVRRGSTDAFALDYRARILQSEGKLEDALAETEKLVALRPKDPDSHSFRGDILNMLKRKDEARKAFETSLGLKPTVGGYLGRAQVRGRDERKLALADIDLATRLEPGAAEPWKVRARFFHEDKDAPNAIKALGEALRLAPDDADVFRRRVLAYVMAGRYDLAIEDLDEVIVRMPNNAGYLNNRCWLKAITGRHLDTALSDCDAALRLKPGSAAILDSRGLVRLKLGRYDAAVADYNEAVRLSPKLAQSRYGRGIAMIRKGAKTEGESDLAAARALNPKIDAEFSGYDVTP